MYFYSLAAMLPNELPTLEMIRFSQTDPDQQCTQDKSCYENPVCAEESKNNTVPNVLDKNKEENSPDANESRISMDWKDDKYYDPHDFCTSKRPVTYCDTLLHFIKAAIGTGILALPNGFKDTGYVIGVLGIFAMSAFTVCCIQMLLAVEYELCRRRKIPNMTYAATVEAAFEEGPSRFQWLSGFGRFSANFLFMLYESGGCAVYIIFISTNLKQVIDFHTGGDINLRLLMAYVMIPIILLCWIPNLKLLAPFSAAANILSIVCFGIVFSYIFQQVPSFEGRRAFGDVNKVPLYLSTALFAIAGTGLMLPLKREMKKPKFFTTPFGILNVGITLAGTLYAIFAFFGYLRYGDQIQSSITLNLPTQDLLAQSVKIFYSFAIFISYTLCYYVVFDIVWVNFFRNMVKQRAVFWEYVTRTLICLVTLFMACAIPNFDLFISLVGAFGISTTTMILPIVIYMLTFYNFNDTTIGKCLFITKNSILLGVSFVLFFTGMKACISDIIQLYYS